MVDAISTNAPVANVAIANTPVISNSVEGSTRVGSVPATDQVNISQEAQLAAQQVFSERPDISTAQEEVVEQPDASEALIQQSANTVESEETAEVTVPPADTAAIEDEAAEAGDENQTAIADLVEL